MSKKIFDEVVQNAVNIVIARLGTRTPKRMSIQIVYDGALVTENSALQTSNHQLALENKLDNTPADGPTWTPETDVTVIEAAAGAASQMIHIDNLNSAALRYVTDVTTPGRLEVYVNHKD